MALIDHLGLTMDVKGVDAVASLSHDARKRALCTIDFTSFVERYGEYNTMVRGDDSLTVADVVFADIIKIIAANCGFIAKVKSKHSVEDTRYCSNIFWPTDDPDLPYKPGPTFKALLKYGAFQTPTLLKEQKLRQYVRGKALGLVKPANHVPVLTNAIQHSIRHTATVKGHDVLKAKHEMARKYRAESKATLSRSAVDFASRVYRVSPTTILDVAAQIDALGWNVLLNTAAAQTLVQAVLQVER